MASQSPEQVAPRPEAAAADGESASPLESLIQLGQTREESYVTLDEIIRIFPEAEEDVEQLEDVFATLLSFRINYVESAPVSEPSEEELAATEEAEAEPELNLDDYLANIDTDNPISLYLKEISRVPLLTHEEEISLSQRMEQGRLAREELAQGDIESKRKQELKLLINDGWAAREHLITANTRLAVSVAKKYMGRGVHFLDLIQEGNTGLIRATKKYDWRRGHRFSTYATWWIRQAVSRAIADQGRTIRLPVHMHDQINKLLRVQHQLTQRLGRDPTVEELAEALQKSPEKVAVMLQVARRPLSLQAPTDDEESSELGDFIEDDEIAPDDTAAYNLLREHINEVLNGLPPRAVRILQLRYGLVDGQVYTLQEVGDKMGVTRERVRQIESQALSRLRNPAIRRQLRDYLGIDIKPKNLPRSTPFPQKTQLSQPPSSSVTSALETRLSQPHDLSPHELQVINLRFPLKGLRTYTLEAVGRIMGISRQRVHQIETEALQKLGI